MGKKRLIEVVTIFGLIICLFFILWGGSFVAAQEESALHRIKRTGVMRVGWAPYFPWARIDEKTQKVVGIGPEVLEELAKALGNVRMEWVADNWATIPAGLQADKFDTVFPIGPTPERALVCAFTNVLQREAQTFMIKKKDAARFKTYEDIDQPDVKISVTLGVNTDIYVTRLFKKPEIVRFRTTPESLLAMVLGKANVWANQATAISDAMKAYPDLTVMKGHFALGKMSMAIKQGDHIFLNWLNLFIDDMKETGTLDRIYQKYGTKREVFFD